MLDAPRCRYAGQPATEASLCFPDNVANSNENEQLCRSCREKWLKGEPQPDQRASRPPREPAASVYKTKTQKMKNSGVNGKPLYSALIKWKFCSAPVQMLSLRILFLHSWHRSRICFGYGREYIISVENDAVWYLLNNISSVFVFFRCCILVFLSTFLFYFGTGLCEVLFGNVLKRAPRG